jgi:hypothetical protein
MSVRDREDAVIPALQRLAPHLDGEPDPSFRAATRARLVAMAAVRSPEPEHVRGFKRLLAGRAGGAVLPRWRSRLTAGLAGAALTVTAAASLVGLAGQAGPGDVLYGLKRGTEQTQLALAGDARGQTLLDFASTRLTELQELVDEPTALPASGVAGASDGALLAAGADPELVVSTLETMDDQTTEGTAWLTDHAVTTRSDAPLDDLAVWVAAQTNGLAALAPELPSAAGAAVAHSQALLSDVSARTNALQGALTCGSGPSVGPDDALGPVPAPCVPAPGNAPAQQSGAGDPGTGSTGLPGTTAAPTAPPAIGTGTGGAPNGGTGTGGGTLPGGVPVPTTAAIPTKPPVSIPSIPRIPGSLSSAVPSLTLPGTLLNVPSTDLPLDACLPPLATIGDC